MMRERSGRLGGTALLLAGLFGLLGLSACSPRAPAGFHATDITGATFARDFALTDHTGQARTLADYQGKAVLVFFGFTRCPDICPTTLAEAAAALRLLGPDADRVQVVFITLDPERDTPELLARYVPGFDARFVGLWGDVAQIEATAKAFRVYAAKVRADSSSDPTTGSDTSSGVAGAADDYTIDHTAGSYLYDPQGRVRLFAAYGSGAERLAADLKALLDGA